MKQFDMYIHQGNGSQKVLEGKTRVRW